jgi:hypothetical protein
LRRGEESGGEERREFHYEVEKDWQVMKAKKVIPF